jgi:hypothetical protein
MQWVATGGAGSRRERELSGFDGSALGRDSVVELIGDAAVV